MQNVDGRARVNDKYEEMRTVLLQFEQEVPCQVPTKKRTFYSALRSMLLACVKMRDVDTRNAAVASAHKWFVQQRAAMKCATDSKIR